MARKGSAQRKAVVEDSGRDNPERPDKVLLQEGDQPGGIVDIETGKSVEETIDVNAAARDDDARSDAEKAREKQLEEDERQRRESAGNEPPLRTEDDDGERRPRSRVAQRRGNRERELLRKSGEQVSDLTRRLSDATTRLAKLERAGSEKEVTTSIAQMEAQLAGLKTELAAAMEAGDTAKNLDLTIKLTELQGRLAVARRDLEVIKARPAVDPAAAERGAGGGDPGEEQQPQLVADWMTANRKWWNLPSAKALREAAVAIDKQIREEIADGELEFGEYSEDHIDELTLRLAEERERLGDKFMDFEIRDFEGEVFDLDQEPEGEERDRSGRRETAAAGRDKGNDVRGNERGSRRAPQGGMGGREGRRGAQSDLELARQGKARLTEDDYEQMRIFRLDPNNPDVRKRFAKERVRTILTEANKAGK